MKKKKIYNSKINLIFSKFHDKIYEVLEGYDQNSDNQEYWEITQNLRNHHKFHQLGNHSITSNLKCQILSSEIIDLQVIS